MPLRFLFYHFCAQAIILCTIVHRSILGITLYPLYRDSNQSQRDLPALRWDRPRNSSCAFMESFLINSIFYFSFFFRNANWIYNKLQKSFIFQYTITLSSNWICNIKQVYFIFHIQFARYKICFWIAKPYTAQNHLVQCSTFISFYCKLNIKYT